MDLRTFVKPERAAPSPPPAIGDVAPALSDAPPAQGRARLVAFLRHVGCPFAEVTVRELDAISLRHPAVQFIAVSQGTPAATRQWCARLRIGYGVTIVDDPDGRLYVAWGLGLTSLGHFLGWRSVCGAMSLAVRGIHNRHPSGSRWQSAGTFAVDAAGIVRWRHLPVHAGDLPDLAAALRALEPATSAPRSRASHGDGGLLELR